MTPEDWEDANPEYVKGWDDALRAASELTLHVYCREFDVGGIAHDSPIGRVMAQQRRLLRRPTMLEASVLMALGFINQESVARLAALHTRLSTTAPSVNPRDADAGLLREDDDEGER